MHKCVIIRGHLFEKDREFVNLLADVHATCKQVCDKEIGSVRLGLRMFHRWFKSLARERDCSDRCRLSRVEIIVKKIGYSEDNILMVVEVQGISVG